MAAILGLLLLNVVDSKNIAVDKIKFCSQLDCNGENNLKVCGIRREDQGFRLRLFENECELLNYGCKVEESKAYGIISMNYCDTSMKTDSSEKSQEFVKNKQKKAICDVFCKPTVAKVCALRKDGVGFKIKLFRNECELLKHNCETGMSFEATDIKVCLKIDMFKDVNKTGHRITRINSKMPSKHLFVVDASTFNINNINKSVENFFADTHAFDLPVGDVSRNLNESSRRTLLKIAGPVVVFQPWITIPKNISEDYYHRPTLSSCFHKCPTKCPDTYTPVCGVPGMFAREPSLMFQNHCFMDVAQCKMYWEDKSSTAKFSSYIESPFLFCLGEELHGLYRFLPLIRTLQHMGRLKKKGHFRYKLNNMRFFNNLLAREPHIMG